jgi:xanthine permease XanP
VDLVYGLNEWPPLRLALLVAFQHVLAVFVGIVTPPLLIARALKLSTADSGFLVSMALLVSGLGTILQSRRLGPVGSGLLSVQGTSFVFVTPIITLAGVVVNAGGTQRQALGVVFGTCMVASIVPILIGPFIGAARRLITPLVTGIVVTLIGLTLIQIGISSVGGGFEARQHASFGSAGNLGLAALVMLIIVILNSSRREWLRMTSVVCGLASGYLVALLLGKLDLSSIRSLGWIAAPEPLRFGLGLRPSAIIPFAFLYVITVIESIGDLTATSSLTGEPIEGALYLRRLRGGVIADGVSSMIAALFNSFPSTTFAQNNGVIQLTGVGSRHIGSMIGLLLILLGLFPVVGGLVEAMPSAVLGGATIIMFGMVAVAGIRILSGVRLDRRAATIAALSIGLGLGVTFVPELAGHMPAFVSDILASGIATGGLCALGLNLLLPGQRA